MKAHTTADAIPLFPPRASYHPSAMGAISGAAYALPMSRLQYREQLGEVENESFDSWGMEPNGKAPWLEEGAVRWLLRQGKGRQDVFIALSCPFNTPRNLSSPYMLVKK